MSDLDNILFDLAYQEGKSVSECLYDVYEKGRADGFQQGVDDTTKRYKDSYMARDIEQIRAEALKPIAKIIDDFACGRIEQSLSALNLINHSIAEQLKEQK